MANRPLHKITVGSPSVALLLSIASYFFLIRAFKVASRSEVRELLQAVHKIIGIRVEQKG